MAINNSSVIYIDSRDKAVHYYGFVGGRNIHEIQNYKSADFDTSFFADFTGILQGFMRKYTPAQAVNSTIILPDSVVTTDIITFPAMKGGAMKGSVETTLSAMYKNRPELRLNTFFAVQNKQYFDVYVCGIREIILSALKSSCASSRFAAQFISFESEAAVRAAASLNQKLKGSNYVLLDIKENYSRFTFVLRGMALGFASLPFGYDILVKPKLAAEDMLFDHSVAELAVLNARERAKAKALTIMGDGNVDATQVNVGNEIESVELNNNNDESEESFSSDENYNVTRIPENTIKTLPKKIPRKLPKYMLRPAPETTEGIAKENFRIFAKWALCYLQGNGKITQLVDPKTVYVNLPPELNYVVTAIDEERDENGIAFVPASFETKDDFILRNLELYGATFMGTSKNNNVF